METMNPAGNTSAKSWNNDLRQPLKRQGILADLSPSSSGQPRMAAVSPEPGQRSKGHIFAIRPAMPGGHGTGDGQAPPRQEDPLHDTTREYLVQTLNTGVYARFGYMPPPPSCLWNIDASVPLTGPAQEHPPVGEPAGPGWTPPGLIGAPSFGGALETPLGDENADLFDLTNCLLSDDYEAYDPEDPNIRALMADFEASILGTGPDTDLDAGAAPPTGPTQEHSLLGESPDLVDKTGNIEPGEHSTRLTGEQRQAIQHIFETDPILMICQEGKRWRL